MSLFPVSDYSLGKEFEFTSWLATSWLAYTWVRRLGRWLGIHWHP